MGGEKRGDRIHRGIIGERFNRSEVNKRSGQCTSEPRQHWCERCTHHQRRKVQLTDVQRCIGNTYVTHWIRESANLVPLTSVHMRIWGIPAQIDLAETLTIFNFFHLIYYIPHSTEYCKNMSEIFPIFHCKWNIVATFSSNITIYFIPTLKF